MKCSKKKWIAIITLVVASSIVFTISMAAAGNVAGAVEDTWNAAKSQIK